MYTYTYRFERLEDGEVSPQLPSPVPQPAVVTTRLEGVGVVRTTDVRVSERTLLNDLKLQPIGPIYNQLTGEVRMLLAVAVTYRTVHCI